MNYTEHIHLLKPETDELFNVQHANSNAELLDAAITAKASLEQVAAMLEQIIETGQITDVDIGAVTTIKEILHNTGFRIGVGTEAELAALEDAGLLEEGVLYIPSDEDTGWQDLTLLNGWTTYSFSGTEDDTPQAPQIRRIGNHVYVRGAIANTDISPLLSVKKIFAVAPEGMKATRHVFRSTTGFGLSVSRLETNPSGDLFTRAVFDLESGERLTSCAWMSIDMDYIID